MNPELPRSGKRERKAHIRTVPLLRGWEAVPSRPGHLAFARKSEDLPVVRRVLAQSVGAVFAGKRPAGCSHFCAQCPAPQFPHQPFSPPFVPFLARVAFGSAAPNAGLELWRHAVNLVHLLLLPCTLLGGGVDDPWADRVIEYVAINPNTGFDNPQNAVGAPRGGTTAVPNNSSVVSLGTAGSYIVLGFDTPIEDDPLNPFGLDFIVYSNAFWIGGNPQNKFTEPALIEIQEDHNDNGIPDGTWYVIPGSRNFPQSVVPDGIPPPEPPMTGVNPNLNDGDPSTNMDEYNWGYAELTPTQQEYLDNYLRPDDPTKVGLTPRSGGGDAFDIAWAVDADGNPAGLERFHFIRIWSFINDGSTPEIMAVADVAADIDSDGDGILDAYEIRVSGTDPFRAESTVLALEIPLEDGGSPAGTHLGIAADPYGNSLSFYSSGTRTGARDFNCIVDILPGIDSGGFIPYLKKTEVVMEFQSSVEDFQAAQIHDAVFAMAYGDAQVEGIYESTLRPWRLDDLGYTQSGISLLQVDRANNIVEFSSRYPGTFILAGVPKPDPEGLPLHPAAHAMLVLFVVILAVFWKIHPREKHG